MCLEINSATYALLLRNCGNEQELLEGKFVHARILTDGFGEERYLGNLLIEMYGKCRETGDARKVFDTMRNKNVFSWNLMTAAYIANGLGSEALQVFRQLPWKSVKPDKYTFTTILNVFSGPEFLEEGKDMHNLISKSGLDVEVAVGNALINMYGRCESLDDARMIFDSMPKRSVISWNGIIAACVQNENNMEALYLFQQMQLQGMEPNKITFVSILDACACLAAIEFGKEMHSLVMHCSLQSDLIIGTALVDMYGKCGCLQDAEMVFNGMIEQDVVLWNAMIAIYGQNGYGWEAIHLVSQMKLGGIAPNGKSFIATLSACAHAGLVQEGTHYFVSTCHDHGVAPWLEHYGCMIALLGREGNLKEAEDIIHSMPFHPDGITWMSLLSACSLYQDFERGKCAALHVLSLEPNNAAAYVLLSNICAVAGKWDEMMSMRKQLFQGSISDRQLLLD